MDCPTVIFHLAIKLLATWEIWEIWEMRPDSARFESNSVTKMEQRLASRAHRCQNIGCGLQCIK